MTETEERTGLIVGKEILYNNFLHQLITARELHASSNIHHFRQPHFVLGYIGNHPLTVREKELIDFLHKDQVPTLILGTDQPTPNPQILEMVEAGYFRYCDEEWQIGHYADIFLRTLDHISHRAPQIEDVVEEQGLVIDPNKRLVTLDNISLHVVGNQLKLLYYLAQHKGSVVSNSQIVERIWGSAPNNYVKVVISRLRAVIEADPNNPTIVITVPNQGYMMRDTSQGSKEE